MFNNLNSYKNDIETTLYGKKLILKNLYQYVGPLTMQYLPYGGIQMIINGQMAVNKGPKANNKTISLLQRLLQELAKPDYSDWYSKALFEKEEPGN